MKCQFSAPGGLSRRRWLAAALAAPGAAQRLDRPWPEFAANDVIPYHTSGLTHGPSLGRPSHHSMRVWVRTREPGPFRVVYDLRPRLDGSSPFVDGATRAGDDNTGWVDLTGLAPNSRYTYGIVRDGKLADTRFDHRAAFPSFRTFPDASSFRDERYNPQGLYNFRFSVGCCADQHPTRSGGQYGNPPVFATMMDRHGGDLLFHLNNGDFIYEEARPPYTTENSRQDYRLYLTRGVNLANFLRHVPSLYTYDDHETWSDMEGAGEVGLKKGKWLARDLSLKPWYEYAGWANFAGPQSRPLYFGRARTGRGSGLLTDQNADFSTLDPATVSTILINEVHDSAGVYGLEEIVGRNTLRVRPNLPAAETVGYSIGAHHYYDWKMGNCHFFMIDARGERNLYMPEKAHHPDRFILGAAQERWLTEKIRATDAQFIFITSSVSWMIYHTDFHTKASKKVAGRSPKEDGFTGAVQERERLLKFFDSLDKTVIIFSGDLHNSFSVQVTDNVWEFMVGPLNSAAHPRATAGYPPYGGWFDSEGRKVKIKWAAGFPDEVHYSRLHGIYYAVVQVNNVLKSGRQDGPGLHWVAYDAPQVVVSFHDGYTGEMLYAEGISMADTACG